MSVVEQTRTVLDLEANCLDGGCREMAAGMCDKLDTPTYTQGVSLLPVPESLEAWRDEHRTARKRADRATRLGYRFEPIDRSLHNDAIYEINTSKAERQGRPMSEGYLSRYEHGALPDYPCSRHRVHTYGVLDESLRAYLTLYRIGQLALVSMILGHGEHLRNDVMYLLFQGVVHEQAGQGGFFYYNRHDSGTEGLRFYKERVGFAETDIEWAL